MKPHSRAAARRRADFSVLYERHSREVWAVVYARCFNAETALDIVQEAFLRLWRAGEQGETVLNARAWLMRVGRNLAEDHAKTAFRRHGTQPPHTLNGVASHEPPPAHRVETEETFARLRQVLGEMSEADREILTMRYALDYDTPRIAEALGINSAAVHMRLSRARQRVGERMGVPQGVSMP